MRRLSDMYNVTQKEVAKAGFKPRLSGTTIVHTLNN